MILDSYNSLAALTSDHAICREGLPAILGQPFSPIFRSGLRGRHYATSSNISVPVRYDTQSKMQATGRHTKPYFVNVRLPRARTAREEIGFNARSIIGVGDLS
jgi:hypothetical protein